MLYHRGLHQPLHQHHGCEEDEDDHSGGRARQAFVTRQVQMLVLEVEPDLPLNERIDEQSYHGQQKPRQN